MTEMSAEQKQELIDVAYPVTAKLREELRTRSKCELDSDLIASAVEYMGEQEHAEEVYRTNDGTDIDDQAVASVLADFVLWVIHSR